MTTLTRAQLDIVLTVYCDQIGLTCSDLHEDAFLIQSKRGYWEYLWYDGDENVLSEFVKRLESYIRGLRLNLIRDRP